MAGQEVAPFSSNRCFHHAPEKCQNVPSRSSIIDFAKVKGSCKSNLADGLIFCELEVGVPSDVEEENGKLQGCNG